MAGIVLLVTAVVAATLAYAWRRPAGEAQQGHDLAVYGPQSSGVIGFNRVRQGSTYRFAFPVPRNKSDQAVKLTGASIEQTPAGVQVLGYPIYSLKEVGDYLLNYDDSDPGNALSLKAKKDYSAEGVTIAPGSDSEFFVMVAVKVVGAVTQVLSGCSFDYTVGSRKYHQSFPCEFQLGDSR